jgi:cytidine deaminase
MGICAERNAINHAVANGMYEFEAIAVTSNLDEPIKPCGMCLQYIGEFSHISNIDIEIVMVGANGQINQSRISDMLPESFGPKSLGIDLSQYRNKSDQQNTI